MATSQVNGNQSTSSSTRNNGGAVINAGNSESCSSLSSSNSIKYVGTIDNNYADKILIGGQFNTINTAPISAKITQLLNTTMNFGIYFANKDPEIQSINNISYIRTDQEANAFRRNKYNFYTGKFDIGYPLNSQDFFGSDLSYTNQFTINIGNPIPNSL